MKKLLLVLGGNPYQAPLAQIGKELGYRVAVFDQNPSCTARQYADIFEEVSIADTEACLDLALPLKPDGICTAGTDFTTTVSRLCEELLLAPNLPPDRFVPFYTAMDMSNKGFMRHTLNKAGVAQPWPYVVVADGEMAWESGLLPEGRVIVKPVQSMGSRGVSVCFPEDNFLESVRYAQRSDPSRSAIVEPFIEDARFLSVDSMWLDGRLVFLATADRLIQLEEDRFPIELGHSVPAQLSSKEIELVRETMLRVGEAYHYRTGFIKGDLMLKDGKCLVGEVAARVSGSFNSGMTVPLVYGFSLHTAVVKVAMGEPDLTDLFEPMNEPSGHAVERTLVSRQSGKVKSIELDHHGLEQATLTHVFVREGDPVRHARTNVDKLAQVVSYGFTYEIAEERALNALASIMIEVE